MMFMVAPTETMSRYDTAARAGRSAGAAAQTIAVLELLNGCAPMASKPLMCWSMGRDAEVAAAGHCHARVAEAAELARR